MPIKPYFLSQAVSGGVGSVFLDGGNIVTEPGSTDALNTGAVPASAFYTDPTTKLRRPIFTLLIPSTANDILDQYPTTTFTPEFQGYGFGKSTPPAPYNGDTQMQALTVHIPEAEYPFESDLIPYNKPFRADGGSGLFIGIDFAQGFAVNNPTNQTESFSAARRFAIYNNITHRSCIFNLVSGSSFADPQGLLEGAGQTTNQSVLTGLYGWGTDAVPQEIRNPLHRGGFL